MTFACPNRFPDLQRKSSYLPWCPPSKGSSPTGSPLDEYGRVQYFSAPGIKWAHAAKLVRTFYNVHLRDNASARIFYAALGSCHGCMCKPSAKHNE